MIREGYERDRRGQVFDTDNEGAYGLVSESFDSFYQNWLEQISDVEKLKKEPEERELRQMREEMV